MILTKTVKFKINGSKIKYYRELGYDVPHNNAEVEIRVEDLSKGSSIKIKCVCKVCNKTFESPYCDYLKNIEKYGYYTCYGSCSRIKMKQTYSERYGECNPTGRNEIKEKKKNTNFKKYGVDSYAKTKEYKEKTKKNQFRKIWCRKL